MATYFGVCAIAFTYFMITSGDLFNFNKTFCKHKYLPVARHTLISETLYKCKYCGLYMSHFKGMFVHYEPDEIKLEEYIWNGWWKI